MILYPNAKINLGLSVINKRSDGYHNISTLMYPIGLTDTIKIKEAACKTKGKVYLQNLGLQVDGNVGDNIITKAYELLNADFNLPSVSIELTKNIPFGAGLGGGSSDASYTLKGLSRFFNLNISDNKLEKYASQLGSDCAFFVRNKPALSEGRGEILTLFDIDLSNFYFALVVPPISVSTKIAYSGVAARKPKMDIKTILRNEPVDKWKDLLTNDFEDSVFKQYPDIENVKSKLYSLGAVYTSMSGSGSAVFGLFNNKFDAVKEFPSSYFVKMV